MKLLVLVLGLLMGVTTLAGTNVTKLEPICFEAGNGMNAQQKAMESCQKFAQSLMKTTNQDVYFQVSCVEGTSSACDYGYNLKAQANITMIQTNTCTEN